VLARESPAGCGSVEAAGEDAGTNLEDAEVKADGSEADSRSPTAVKESKIFVLLKVEMIH
jgi:hypothetical protein